MNIPAGTVMKASGGSSLTALTVSDATNLPAPPSGKVIVLAKDFGPAGATFDPAIGLTLTYNQAALPGGVQEGSFVMAYWDGSQWVPLSSSVNTDANTVSASIGRSGIVAVLGSLPPPTTPAPVVPAKFAVTRVAVSPVECKPGDTVNVSATVANTGGTQGQYDVVFLVNGTQQDSKAVTLGSGASAEVTFTTKAGSGPKIYVADVNGTQGTFVVQAAETTSSPPPTAATPTGATSSGQTSSNGWMIGGLIAVAAAVVVLFVIMIARGRKPGQGAANHS